MTFRPAWPDEANRARYVEGAGAPAMRDSRLFLALDPAFPERIVGVIRHAVLQGSENSVPLMQFRLSTLAGSLNDEGEEFLAAFLAYLQPHFTGLLHHLPILREDIPLSQIFRRLGFQPSYRELRLECPREKAGNKSRKVLEALLKRNSFPGAQIIPARAASIEQFLPLLSPLIERSELSAIWKSPDPSKLDRDASACVIHEGRVLGAVLCADMKTWFRVMALAGNPSIPGAKRFVSALLMDHLSRYYSERNRETAIFRTNPETSSQIRNLALRGDGVVHYEACRWAYSFAPPSSDL